MSDSWSEFQKLAADPKALINSLLNYNIKEMRIKHLEMVRAFLKENNLDKQEDNAKVAKVSTAVKQIHQWILNLLEEVENNPELHKEMVKREE